MLPHKYWIDSHKALTGPYVLALIAWYRAWEQEHMAMKYCRGTLITDGLWSFEYRAQTKLLIPFLV